MKKIYINTFVILTAIALMTLSSCLSEDLGGCENLKTPEKLSISLSLSSAQKLRTTRALPTESGDHDGTFNENNINKLDLFFYQDNVLKCHVPSSGLSMEEVSTTEKNITIPVTTNLKELIEATNSVYDVYVVANNSADLSKVVPESSLKELKKVLLSTPEFVNKGGAEAQQNFAMDGKLLGINVKINPNMGKIELKRAASKIRLRILEINDTSGEGYEFDPVTMHAQARLVHFLDQATLLQESNQPTTLPTDASGWKTTEWRDINTTLIGDLSGNTTVAPFYAYANDWNEDTGRESYIELKVPFKKEGITKDFYYMVPITPYTTTNTEMEPHLRKIERDFLYDIAIKINHVGVTADEPPVELEGNYTIADWSETEVTVQIFMFHYLMVTPKDGVMANTNTIELDFLASVEPVQYKDLKVSYTYVDNETGQPVTKTIADGPQYANIVLNNETKKITITSAVPTNYIPKDIEFTVYTQPSNLLTMELPITIKQVSATYFTTELGSGSSERPHGNFVGSWELENLKNKHMYIVTSMASDGTGTHRWGFPPVDANGNTLNNASVAKMISPKFMMASQLGATDLKNYVNARDHCKGYWEKTEKDGVTVIYDDWRLPTEAEIAYIDNLQHDSNNPQGLVMTGEFYWDAYSGNGAYKMRKGSGGNFTNAYVRCIRDVKE